MPGRSVIVVVVVIALIGIALLPWIISGLSPQPLLPDELVQQRDNYNATVSAAQQSTRTAENRATVVPNIHILGTLPPDAPGFAPTSTPPVIDVVDFAPTDIPATPIVQTTSIITVRTVGVATPTLAAGGETPSSSDSTPEATMTDSASSNGSGTPPTPASGMEDVEDVISEAMLAQQIAKDSAADGLSNLVVTLHPDSVSATGNAEVAPGIIRKIEVTASFTVAQSSLLTTVSSVRSENLDLTAEYHAVLESRLNTSLYRLLPQRYVQSFILEQGAVRVYSKIRSQ